MTGECPAFDAEQLADVDAAEVEGAVAFLGGFDLSSKAAIRSFSSRFLLAQKLSMAASCSPRLMMAS